MTSNRFVELHTLGYHALVPIVPPLAVVSDKSSLYKRVDTDNDPRGKTPGVKFRDGKWSGFDWVDYKLDEADLKRWHDMGAGVGIKTGDGLIAIDADTLDDSLAKIIKEMIERHLGELPIRIGQSPKALYVCRVSEPMRYTRVEFGKERVEVLSDGRQFVAYGIHPKTKQDYRWLRGPTAREQLPEFTAAKITALMEALRAVLPDAKPLITEGAKGKPSPAALRGDPDTIRRAVEATPNTTAAFPTREAYRDYGYAIKASLPGAEAEALTLFQDWCARWESGDPKAFNDPDVVVADFGRMKPPFRRGSNWIYEQSEKHSAGAFTLADAWFKPIGLDNPFAAINAAAEAPKLDPIEWIDPRQWEGQAIEPREWEVEGWIPRFEVSLVYGDGGIGKTLMMHQYATAAATGVKWLGLPTRKARVMCFFCEDDKRELQRRQVDINRALGVTLDQLGDLRIASRKFMENLLVLWNRNTGEMKRQAVWEQLLGDAKEWKADVVIIDTIADTYGGNESDRGQVNSFIKSVLGRLAQEIGGSVIALGHPSVAGMTSGSGTAGSTNWSNACRSRMFLRYPKGVDRGNIRELKGMKLNYGAVGSVLKLRWAKGAFEVLAVSSASANDEAPEIGDLVTGLIYDTLECTPGVAYAVGKRSGSYIVTALRAHNHDAFQPYDEADILAAVEAMKVSGTLDVTLKGNYVLAPRQPEPSIMD